MRRSVDSSWSDPARRVEAGFPIGNNGNGYSELIIDPMDNPPLTARLFKTVANDTMGEDAWLRRGVTTFSSTISA